MLPSLRCQSDTNLKIPFSTGLVVLKGDHDPADISFDAVLSIKYWIWTDPAAGNFLSWEIASQVVAQWSK